MTNIETNLYAELALVDFTKETEISKRTMTIKGVTVTLKLIGIAHFGADERFEYRVVETVSRKVSSKKHVMTEVVEMRETFEDAVDYYSFRMNALYVQKSFGTFKSDI